MDAFEWESPAKQSRLIVHRAAFDDDGSASAGARKTESKSEQSSEAKGKGGKSIYERVIDGHAFNHQVRSARACVHAHFDGCWSQIELVLPGDDAKLDTSKLFASFRFYRVHCALEALLAPAFLDAYVRKGARGTRGLSCSYEVFRPPLRSLGSHANRPQQHGGDSAVR